MAAHEVRPKFVTAILLEQDKTDNLVAQLIKDGEAGKKVETVVKDKALKQVCDEYEKVQY